MSDLVISDFAEDVEIQCAREIPPNTGGLYIRIPYDIFYKTGWARGDTVTVSLTRNKDVGSLSLLVDGP